MYVKDYLEVPSEPGGVEGLTVRWVINASQGATKYAMRVFELEPGKVSPFHQHDNEHEVFVLNGNGEVETPEGVAALSAGLVVFIAEDERHQFRNIGNEPLRFLDVVLFEKIAPRLS